MHIKKERHKASHISSNVSKALWIRLFGFVPIVYDKHMPISLAGLHLIVMLHVNLVMQTNLSCCILAEYWSIALMLDCINPEYG